uniref:UDP-glycosyltransferases domain-containing protein n=1 Tax=Nelumbo nucifera TaxID=4432 RepID=A0A822XNH2_NELNU|nr:TPA_asm: hypothetical protein HUJ06_020531 [Nelumbo nucifera]
MVKPILDRTDKAYTGLLNMSTHLPKSSGVIVNTFVSLEIRAIKALSNGVCVPEAPTPPIYYIGPVIAADDRNRWWRKLHKPRVFNEIAVGLEEERTEVLVGGAQPTQTKTQASASQNCRRNPIWIALLPEGFLERTKDRGLVVKSWAPQTAVLKRESVGGFVTHCGWNSILEAVTAGVPMVAWPLYAEQRFFKQGSVGEEMKLALWMHESEDGFVSAAEVEKQVRGWMESEEGKAIRKRTLP